MTHEHEAEPRLGHYPPSDFPAPVRALAAMSRGLAFLEGVMIVVGLAALIALATYKFAINNLRLHGYQWAPQQPEWLDGVIRHSVFVLGLLGASYATFTARHIRIDAVSRTITPRWRMAVRALTTLVAIVICALLFYAAYDLFQHDCHRDLDSDLLPPFGEGVKLLLIGHCDVDVTVGAQLFTPPRGEMVIMLGLAIVIIHFFVQLLIDLVWVATGRQPPASWVAEASHGEAPPMTNQESMTPPTLALREDKPAGGEAEGGPR